MTNTIAKLRYVAQPRNLATEDQMVDLLKGLRNLYENLLEQGMAVESETKPITSARQFIEAALGLYDPVSCGESTKIKVSGSGNIEGIILENGTAEYDFSDLQQYGLWDKLYARGNCFGCLSQIPVQYFMEVRLNCEQKLELDEEGYPLPSMIKHDGSLKDRRDFSGTCPIYRPAISSTKGDKPRKLAELISEATE